MPWLLQTRWPQPSSKHSNASLHRAQDCGLELDSRGCDVGLTVPLRTIVRGPLIDDGRFLSFQSCGDRLPLEVSLDANEA